MPELRVGAFGVQVQVEFGEQRRETIRVVEFDLAAAPELQVKTVLPGIGREMTCEEALRIDLFHRDELSVRVQLRVGGLRQKRAHFPLAAF